MDLAPSSKREYFLLYVLKLFYFKCIEKSGRITDTVTSMIADNCLYKPVRGCHPGTLKTQDLISFFLSRNVDQGLRGTRSTAAHYNTLNRMDRHRAVDDHYSPDRER